MWSGPPGQRRPANCTDIAPPDIPSSHIAVFDAETQTWSLQEDHRGETVYDTTTGNQVYISDLGRYLKTSHQFHQVVDTKNGIVRLRSG